MEAVQKRVTKIERAAVALGENQIRPLTKRRVAAYARVSTDSDEQFTSFEAQVDYYTRQITANPDWTMVEVYTDEGISGTNTKKREGFNRMISDALMGKIDLIITKSISRFARNTVDTLTAVRQLKEKGVEVYFEKENIYTMDSKGELLITIMSSLAQEESRSISENVAWGKRAKCEEGKVYLPYKQFLGYEKGEDDIPRIVEKEAVIVQRIYALFMAGKTPGGIARLLTADGIPTPAGKEQWRSSTVESILTNEKYKGAALLQKKFTVDFLLKKMKPNEGEVPQYYIEKSHEPIIDPVEFELVQAEFARRKAIGYSYSGNSILASRIVCGDCGAYFGSKVWNSTSKYRRTIWQCNAKFQNGEHCSTPHLDEEEIKARFVTAYNTLTADKTQLLDDCRIMQTVLSDCSSLDAEIPALQEELDVVAGLIRKCVEENSRDAQNQSEYGTRYKGYVERYEAAQNKLEALRREHALRQAKADAIGAFMFAISEQDVLTYFDAGLWTATIRSVTVHSDGRMAFHFMTGADIEA